ncbi:unnamed protein product [Arabidopsis lyrata]|uniref:Srp40 C-terminal domain-containing protein n=1 Tax=Arabidopsis lyrata subsp. lyrata TaxID=81972 RepID=D7MMA8_ARALL|nr:nucleolar and coiled-body phosphoprotein 1 [Arabidopsis lyrata subsp. lyrata]EFH42444.1 hypothetical protein ARALYDRAFT_495806 [Arabidopsis lyrata subsp. lyrata]CAH8279962.1 unnamed protein product [Arabidopsis lyrata]|eukprot:XP_002866185.1 nucleolar and coiled-body phosphoprotein 1 [Arabidopsis lyrata subsp. lyrata]
MGNESKTSTLESEQKALLLRSIAQYLELCGFSKCFKKLLSEAEIEKKELNTSLPDLEDIFSEFLKKRDHEAAAGNTEANVVEGVENVKKEKKKKKKKETKVEVTEEEKVKETDAEIDDGVKEKKKKKNKSKSVEAGDDKEKVSKKRKRSEPEETKEETEDDDEESKRRKKEENVQETPVKETETKENGNVEKSEMKSTNQKSGKGLSNSKEPKKPFQRVNVDEIVFTEQSNSYNSKHGAAYGYGLKAQEVLGQVKGRGFRHEKTKKKRGSYRGGEIDLESHSTKFPNSDSENE